MNPEIESLARWMHQTWMELPAVVDHYGPTLRPWDDLPEIVRTSYRIMAERLLTDPPACLTDRPMFIVDATRARE